MKITYQWFNDNQFVISYILCFFLLSYFTSILWAIVLFVTVELVENNFNIRLNSINPIQEDSIKERCSTTFREYTFENSGPHSTEYYIRTNTTNTSHNNSSQKMFSSDGTFLKMRQNQTYSKGEDELRPSLSSLIHKGRSKSNKENRSDAQPLLAVIKNNIHLRHRTQLSSQSPKSPLYKNLIPTPRNSPLSSTFGGTVIHKNSGWISPATLIKSPGNSPPIPLNRDVYDVNNTRAQGINKSVSSDGVFEVHGSYFINKSLLHSNLNDDEPSFSIVNSKFQSPVDQRSNSLREAQKKHNISTCGETSTESVVSALKEKCKRKRKSSDQSNGNRDEDDDNPILRKKMKRTQSDSFDNTLNELFPSPSSMIKKRKKLNDGRAPTTYTATRKKSSSSVGTQYEELQNESTTISKKSRHNSPSPSRNRVGLTEQQTNDLMEEDSADDTLLPAPAEKASVQKSKEEQKQEIPSQSKDTQKKQHKEVTFSLDDTACGDEAFNTPVKVDENDEGSKNKSTIFKSLKSPYKKILQTSALTSSLLPGSAEKRRKHPVYFTAKINIDEIQSIREEYGDRGASLKAFRLDQEEAQQRVDSLLEEADESDKNAVTSATVTKTTASGFSAPLSISDTGLLASLKSGVTVTTSTIQFPTVVQTSTSNDQQHPYKHAAKRKTVTFNFSSAAPTTSSGDFTFPTITTANNNSNTIVGASTFQISSVSQQVTLTSSTGPALSFSLSQNNSQKAANPVISRVPTSSFSFASSSGATPINSSSFKFGPVTDNSALITSTVSFQAALTKSNTALTTQANTNQLSNNQTALAPTFNFGRSHLQSTSATTSATTGLLPALVTISSQSFGTPTQSSVNTIQSSQPQPTPAVEGFNFNASISQSLQKSTINSFSVSSSNNIFATSANIFKSSSTTTATSNNIFAATSQPIFVATTTPFGGVATSQQSQSQQPASNIFAKPAAVSGFSFAQQNTTSTSSTSTTSSGFSFGATSNSVAAPTNIFAATTSTIAPTTTTIAPTPFGQTSNVFGNNAASVSSTQNIFSTNTTTTIVSNNNIFGSQPTTQSNIFGNSNATGNVFGQQPTNSSTGGFSFGQSTANSTPFGNNNNAANKPGFSFGVATTASNTIFGQPSTTSSVFGQPATSASSFGQPNASSVFGQQSTSSIFGQQPSTNTVFGQQTSANVFGSSTTTASSFGSNKPQPFGTSQQTSSVFGSNATTQANPFSQTQQTNKSGFDFSSSMNKPNSFAFGSAQSTPAKQGFNFGGQANTSFGGGNPSTPSFGTVQPPGFGTPQLGGFGNSASTPSGGFAFGHGGGNPTRQTQRARRRLRK